MMDKWQYLDEAMTASSKKTIKELFSEDQGRAERFALVDAQAYADRIGTIRVKSRYGAA